MKSLKPQSEENYKEHALANNKLEGKVHSIIWMCTYQLNKNKHQSCQYEHMSIFDRSFTFRPDSYPIYNHSTRRLETFKQFVSNPSTSGSLTTACRRRSSQPPIFVASYQKVYPLYPPLPSTLLISYTSLRGSSLFPDTL